MQILENIQEEDNESDISELSIVTSPNKNSRNFEPMVAADTDIPNRCETVDIFFKTKIPQNALFSNKLIFQRPDDTLLAPSACIPLKDILLPSDGENAQISGENLKKLLENFPEFKKAVAKIQSPGTNVGEMKSLSSMEDGVEEEGEYNSNSTQGMVDLGESEAGENGVTFDQIIQNVHLSTMEEYKE
jgi:hypothetical protein